MSCSDIDFVVTWVDNSDPQWQNEFEQYKTDTVANEENSHIRYSEHGLLRYWFRGVEKFAPWVRKIHFVTNGQYPAWLNLNNSKLHFVRHSDYIDSKYLPLFNSHPIENNLHRIEGLSDKFVYFNDDIYIISETNASFFFKNNLPCDAAIMTKIPSPPTDAYFGAITNDIKLINKFFNESECVKRNITKWLNFRYGVRFIIPPLIITSNGRFPGLKNHHSAQAYLKSTFEEVWHHCHCELERTNKSRFRSKNDISHLLFRYWQIAQGNFYPTFLRRQRHYFDIDKDIDKIIDSILKQKDNLICINDASNSDSQYCRVVKALDIILNEKSSFEL